MVFCQTPAEKNEDFIQENSQTFRTKLTTACEGKRRIEHYKLGMLLDHHNATPAPSTALGQQK